MALMEPSSSTSHIDRCPDRDAYLYFHRLLDLCCDCNNHNDELAVQAHIFNDLTFFAKFVPSVWQNEADFQQATRYFVQLCYKIGCQLVDSEQTLAGLPFSEKIKLILQECLELRRKELFKSLVFKVVTSKVAYLENYDWSVSLVLSSDKMSSIKEPILKLFLKIHSPNESNATHPLNGTESLTNAQIIFSKSSNNFSQSNAKVVTFEFTKDELADFIKTLEEAKHELAQAVA